MASSLVGESTIACVFLLFGSTFIKRGIPKEAVFPVPVCAWPITSTPLITTGIACDWIGVASSNPISLIARRSCGYNPNSSNLTVSIFILFFLPGFDCHAVTMRFPWSRLQFHQSPLHNNCSGWISSPGKAYYLLHAKNPSCGFPCAGFPNRFPAKSSLPEVPWKTGVPFLMQVHVCATLLQRKQPVTVSHSHR